MTENQGSSIRKKLISFFTYNWQYKLLSVLAAIVLWGALISQDTTLTREKVFSDIPVTVTGQETAIRNNGMIVVSGLDEENLAVRLWADVPQTLYKTVSAQVYNPRIDLSKITSAGEQTLPILTTSGGANGTVTRVEPETVTVTVDEYVTNYRVPVSVNVVGDYPAGVGGNTPTADPSTVSVSGPSTIVDQIARICVDYDLSRLENREGTFRTALSFRFENSAGEEVENKLLTVTSANILLRTITVVQTVYPITEVPLSAANLVTGTPAEGYCVSQVEITPQTVTIGGDSEEIAAVEKLFIENAVNVDGVSQAFTQAVKIRKPSQLSYLSADTVMVTVNIEPITTVREFTGLRITGEGLSEGLKASFSPKYADVELTGYMNPLLRLKSANITLSVDLSSLTEEGEYQLPVKASVTAEDGQEYDAVCAPEEISVTVKKK